MGLFGKKYTPETQWENILSALKEGLSPIREDWYNVTISELEKDILSLEPALQPKMTNMKFSVPLDEVILTIQTFSSRLHISNEKYIQKRDRKAFTKIFVETLWDGYDFVPLGQYITEYYRLSNDLGSMYTKMAHDLCDNIFGPGSAYLSLIIVQYVRAIQYGACAMTSIAFGAPAKADKILRKAGMKE